jgi:hypothetical protein
MAGPQGIRERPAFLLLFMYSTRVLGQSSRLFEATHPSP